MNTLAIRKTRSWATSWLLVAILATTPALAGDWSEVQLRGGVDLIELVLPIFGETGEVGPGPVMNFAVGWRQLDPQEVLEDPEADGFKSLGIFAGAAFDIRDPFKFNWIQLQGGLTYEELIQLGGALWVGNATETEEDPETGEERSWRVPGLDTKAKLVLGLGVEGDPE